MDAERGQTWTPIHKLAAYTTLRSDAVVFGVGASPTIAVPFALFAEATFPERLKKLRLARGLTQKQLAREAGLAQDLVYLREREYRRPRRRSLERVTAALGVSADDLLAGAGRGGAQRSGRTLKPATSPPRMAGGPSEHATTPRPMAAASS
ncbi:MAG TPA: helix-turn-helix transcriptional regulator [Candidatus Binatia bacterium]